MSDFTDLIDLASQALGGVALLASDDFFAEKDNLLRPRPAVWKEHEYTDRGKWMDGWESRRRRGDRPPDGSEHDWCVVRLGLPGVIRGVVVDTAFFRGNFPESCSVEAAAIAASRDLAAISDPATRWTTIVPRSALKGDSKNLFPVDDPGRWTHLRLNIFPDGGVARLRVHGEVVPDWERLLALGGPVDLAAAENGGQVLLCSDMFFGSRHNLIAPGRPLDMSDGWETRRRRGPGNDWSLVKLAGRGAIRRVELDTTHFKGNAPGTAKLEGIDAAPGTAAGSLVSATSWRELLPETRVQPHTRHHFEDELRVLGALTHVRLSVYPDGGVARLRLWGDPDASLAPSGAGVARLDAQPAAAAHAALLACCGSKAWAEAMTARRPFGDFAALARAAERVWFGLSEEDWLEAFAAHPRIGERSAESAAPGAPGAAWAAQEQAGMAAADAALRERLAAGNAEYERKNGFVYLVCASGKRPDELLAILERRLSRPRAEEVRTAAEEQAAITRLRLKKLVRP